MRVDKPHEPISVDKFVEAIIGVKMSGTEEPIFEFCTSCKSMRTKGRCFNKECKYYGKS